QHPPTHHTYPPSLHDALPIYFESLRFIYSAGYFSPDGRYFAIAAKHKDRDDLVILDIKKDEEVRRIRIPLSGLTTPSWSPDGKRSEERRVGKEGSGLRRRCQG